MCSTYGPNRTKGAHPGRSCRIDSTAASCGAFVPIDVLNSLSCELVTAIGLSRPSSPSSGKSKRREERMVATIAWCIRRRGVRLSWKRTLYDRLAPGKSGWKETRICSCRMSWTIPLNVLPPPPSCTRIVSPDNQSSAMSTTLGPPDIPIVTLGRPSARPWITRLQVL